jgi:hypothetical protein
MMKSFVIAAGILALGATAANAQYYSYKREPWVKEYKIVPWHKEHFPYAERHHKVCHLKAWRLWNYERKAVRDGKLSFNERWIIRGLKRDLDYTCGKWRWRG